VRRRSDELLTRIETAYRNRYQSFVRVALAIVGEEEAARDAVHDGIVGAVRSRAQFRGEGTLEGWLWRSVVNAARQRRRSLPLHEELVGEWPAPVAEPRDELVRDAVARLPERQRLVLFLRYFADLDYRSIGEACGIAEGTVAATLNAAHDAVRRSLEEVETCER
jgi:RNA polymerase sigma factor (sigma-70 family)